MRSLCADDGCDFCAASLSSLSYRREKPSQSLSVTSTQKAARAIYMGSSLDTLEVVCRLNLNSHCVTRIALVNPHLMIRICHVVNGATASPNTISLPAKTRGTRLVDVISASDRVGDG